MHACVKFTFANKIETMSERSHVSVKVESRSTSRLISTIYILPLLFCINFGDHNLPYPVLGSNIPSTSRRGQRFHFLQCRGSLPSLCFVNPKEGKVSCLHQNILTRKVTDIAFSSDFCNNYSHPASPTSLYLTSPRPRPTRPRVLYLMSPSPSSRVPESPHTRPDVPVPLSPSHYYTQPRLGLQVGI